MNPRLVGASNRNGACWAIEPKEGVEFRLGGLFWLERRRGLQALRKSQRCVLLPRGPEAKQLSRALWLLAERRRAGRRRALEQNPTQLRPAKRGDAALAVFDDAKLHRSGYELSERGHEDDGTDVHVHDVRQLDPR